MFKNPIRYIEPVFRPPSEGNSLLIQLTLGCSHNKCSYCAMYSSKKFKERDFEDIRQEIGKAREFYKTVNKVFLCDGDALAANSCLLENVLKEIEENFPENRKVGIYATVKNILDKSVDDLKMLRKHNLQIVYVGAESGCNDILNSVNKNNNHEDYVEASSKLKEAQIKNSTMIMLGLGGKERSITHVAESAKMISKATPEFLSFLATTPIDNTLFKREIESNNLTPLTSKELLQEMHGIISGVETKENIIFRANHVSNQFPIGGTLPRDKTKIVETLQEWIKNTKEGGMPPVLQTL